MSKDISRILADLFAPPAQGEEPSSRMQRLRSELRKAIESEETVSGKFRGLLESFRAIIPDEKQRYHAALQALSTTTKLSLPEIVKAVGGQLEELKVLEKSFLPAPPAWRNELQAMESRARELKGELARLREQTARFEREEQAVLAGKAAREKEIELAEKTMKELFAEIGAEMAAIRKRIEELAAETAAAQPAPPPAPPPPPAEAPKSSAPPPKKSAGEPTIEIKGAPSPQDSKWQKKCPMCGGQMNLLELENMWQCYTCAHEEPTGEDHPGAPAPSSEEPPPDQPEAASADQLPTKKKTCPVCRKKMYWFPDEKAWRCPSCNYERRI